MIIQFSVYTVKQQRRNSPTSKRMREKLFCISFGGNNIKMTEQVKSNDGPPIINVNRSCISSDALFEFVWINIIVFALATSQSITVEMHR